MSRFYDALKQANQSLHVERETPGDEQEKTLGASGIDIPVSRTVPEVGEEAAPAALPAKAPSGPPIEKMPLLAQPVSKNGSFGTSTPVVVDRKARLLPHTLDRAVLEHYRALRTRILQRKKEKMFRSLLVTSPGTREGKTVTVLNLGFVFAMLPSFKVLVVDGDLRRGSLGEWLGVKNRPGLSNLIEGTATLEEAVLTSDELPVRFMVRGTSKASPAELLNSDQLPGLFRKMSDRFDLVVVDSPPVNLVADTQLLASSCDAVLLVVRAFLTSNRTLEEANQGLRRFHVIGTVLNGEQSIPSYGRYDSYYGGCDD